MEGCSRLCETALITIGLSGFSLKSNVGLRIVALLELDPGWGAPSWVPWCPEMAGNPRYINKNTLVIKCKGLRGCSSRTEKTREPWRSTFTSGVFWPEHRETGPHWNYPQGRRGSSWTGKICEGITTDARGCGLSVERQVHAETTLGSSRTEIK